MKNKKTKQYTNLQSKCNFENHLKIAKKHSLKIKTLKKKKKMKKQKKKTHLISYQKYNK